MRKVCPSENEELHETLHVIISAPVLDIVDGEIESVGRGEERDEGALLKLILKNGHIAFPAWTHGEARCRVAKSDG